MSVILGVAEMLDRVRSEILRVTLELRWLRPFFQRRWLRLGALFAVAALVSLGVALLFPLWALLIGPLVYGVPHIFSSMRYVHFAVIERGEGRARIEFDGSGRRLFAASFLLLFAVASYRVFVTMNVFRLEMPQLSEWAGSSYLELIALMLTFFAGAWIYRFASVGALRGLTLLLPFCAVFIRFPMQTIGAMVLLHNFVAFAYWLRAARTRTEGAVAFLALLFALAVTVAIFMGAFDVVYRVAPPSRVLDFASMSVESTGRLIAPYLGGSEAFCLHASIAFAFGQALHYFIWLKAIPDQFHTSEAPTSFRQSAKLLERDFGMKVAGLLILLSLGAIVFWSFFSFQMARMLYFSIASYHGYLEIAGLALWAGNLKRVDRSEAKQLRQLVQG
ncbi:MAG: hypothetical protein P4M08_15010 [Oligoflexia bacterium]|nr:hypothetical protein [Oligoflexia bacterium]